MLTWRELAGLGRDAVGLWRRFLPQLVFWYSLGYAANLLARELSAHLGGEHRVLATLTFGLAIIASACSILLMIHSLGTGLPAYQRLLAVAGAAAPSPEVGAPGAHIDVVHRQSRADTLATVIGPVLAILSVWNVVEDQTHQLYVANIIKHGAFAGEQWSINVSQVQFYVVAAIAVWVLRTIVARVLRWLRDRSAPGGVVGSITPFYIYLEGLWVFLIFVAAFRFTVDLRSWWAERAIQHWIYDGWMTVTGWLPTIVVSIPDLARSLGSWVIFTAIPAAWSVVALPLVYLAVTAVVFGWHPPGTTWRPRRGLQRIRSVGERFREPRYGPISRVAYVLTDDVRSRFVPLITSLRMLVRVGPRFVGSFLVLVAAVEVLNQMLQWSAWQLVGPHTSGVTVMAENVVAFLVGLVVQPLLVAVYGAAFDRSVAEANAATITHDPAEVIARG